MSAFDSVINNETVHETMLKLRTRDKYVVVNEAPWHVYDQFEFFIYPTAIRLTKNFYGHFKTFFLPVMANVEKPVEQDKKYDLIVPTKALNKYIQKSSKHISVDVLSDQNKQGKAQDAKEILSENSGSKSSARPKSAKKEQQLE